MADQVDHIFDTFDSKIVSLMEGLEEHLRDVAIGVQDEMRDYIASELRDSQSEVERLRKLVQERDEQLTQMGEAMDKQLQEITQLRFEVVALKNRIGTEKKVHFDPVKKEEVKATPVIWTKKNERLFKNASVTINRALRDLKPGSKVNPINCDE